MRDFLPPNIGCLKPVEVNNDSGRLPKVVKPIHYEILLDPCLDDGLFSGYVKIEIEVTETTNSIVLHSVDLDIISANVQQPDLTWQTTSITTQPQDETITLSLGTRLEQGTNTSLWITFTGDLKGKMSGFYRGSYKTDTGVEKYIAITQFQACDARRAIPCFDEPALKATFDVTLVASAGLVALSNMDVKSVTEYPSSRSGDDKNAFLFNTTPPMATYLLAFAIGEFNYIEIDSFHVPIRVYTTPDRDVNEGRYAAEITATGMALYEKTFGAEYPLPKLDLVGVASKSGAMENWGLILFVDSALLENKESTSAAAKELVAHVTLHEEAHLWFGDLVTMDWWDGLWLNESFADWVELFAVNRINPQWQNWTKFVTDNLQDALKLDAFRSSHPIEVEVKNTGEINQLFDAITYQKGSSVLRMLATYLGEDIFTSGVRRYIQAHAFGNTKTTDLWEKLSEVSEQDIEHLMNSWTKQVGYPVITVTEDPRANILYVKQNRYISTGDLEAEDDIVLWPVPLGLESDWSNETQLVLEGRQGYFQLPSLDFFKINRDHTGFYRTLYTPERLMKLADAAQKGRLSVADRAGLVADSAALSASGHQSSSVTFYFVKALLDDASFFVWKQIAEWFTMLRQAWLFELEEVQVALKAAQLAFMHSTTHQLGWDFQKDDGSDDKAIVEKFMTVMFTSAGFAGDVEIIAAAQKMFAAFMSGDRSAINANLRRAVFGLSMLHGGETEYDQLFDEYHAAKTTDERSAALDGLGHAISPVLLARNVALLFDESLPFIDVAHLLSTMRLHRAGAEALYDIVLYRWDEFTKRAPADGIGGLRGVLQGLTAGLATERQAVELERAFNGRNKASLDRFLAQLLEGIRVKAKWTERSGGEVENWLRSEGFLRGNIA